MKNELGVSRIDHTPLSRSTDTKRAHREPAGPHLHREQRDPVRLTSAANTAGAAIASTPELLRALDLVRAGSTIPGLEPRILSAAEHAGLLRRLQRVRSEARKKLVAAAYRADSAEAQIMAVLRASSTKKQVVDFSSPAAMQQAIETLKEVTRRGSPLRLVLPIGGGKAPNPLKTGDAYLPDLAEHASAMMLAAVVDAINEVYAPGAFLYMIPDAGLHSDDLGQSGTEHRLHLKRLNEDLFGLKVQDQVSMADSLAHLPEEWADTVESEARRARARMLVDAFYAAEVDAQVQSLRFSMNTRVLGWTYEEHVEAMAALARPELPDSQAEARARAQMVLMRTRDAAARYVGTNHALRILDLPGRILQDLTGEAVYLRLTVHAKPGEPRPALFPSSSLARPGLLPMHGVGVLDWREDKVRVGAMFDLEARMRGFRPVEDTEGRTLFYEVQ